MPEPIKHDWTELVRQRFTLSCAEDVICELASHLEEIYADACASGISDAEAVRIALEHVHDWKALAREIARTKSKEESMNYGTLNHRTKSLWLPGLVSLTAASLLMSAQEFILVHKPSSYFTDISLRPSHLISGLPHWFYIIWLLVQVPCGALGAFLSRRNGGNRVARIVAGTFPALTMFFLCGLVIPISAFFEHNTFALSHPSRLAFGVLIWAAVPAVALVLGAAPFLKEPTLQSA
jgi:hypothetical protein